MEPLPKTKNHSKQSPNGATGKNKSGEIYLILVRFSRPPQKIP